MGNNFKAFLQTYVGEWGRSRMPMAARKILHYQRNQCQKTTNFCIFFLKFWKQSSFDAL